MSHAEKLQRLAEQIRAAAGSAPVGLAKDTSNLFRDRKQAPRQKLDVRQFNEVLSINREERWVEVEGMTPYVKLVDAMLAEGLMPAVVPQLKSITLGGAAAGVGIEATSFRYGLVHETLQELEILLPDGRVVVATPDNDYRDLFYGFPNSYGTLGYALKLKALAVPVKPFVAVRHSHFEDPAAFFAAIEAACVGDANFVDGVVFGPKEMVLSEARFVDSAPYTSDYTYQKIYYRSLRQRDTDYLTTRDYIWRWDTDWFWCSKNLGAQNPLVRRLLGRERLNSVFYTRMMRWNSKWGLTRHLDRLLGRHRESVIQDVDIPAAQCAGLPRVLPARNRHPADLDLPDPALPPRRALHPVPDGSVHALPQLRFLGRGAPPPRVPCRPSQPPGREQGCGTGRYQVAVLGVLLRAGRLLAHLRRPGLPDAQG
jgi:FAD/FMN-containing dehydrogenase